MFCAFFFCKGKHCLCLPDCFPSKCSPFIIVSTHKRKNLLLGSKFIPLRVDPDRDGKDKRKQQDCFLESVQIHLNWNLEESW